MSKNLPNKEYKLRIPKSNRGHIRGGPFVFCSTEFRAVVKDLPADLRHCYLVLTEERTPDSYRITKPFYNTYSERYEAGISAVRTGVFPIVRAELAKVYRKGYRYGHIEYDDE